VAAVARARRAGLAELSVDLIFGLPDSVPRDWRAELEAALALEVPHLSLYGLTAEVGTGLGRQVREGHISLADDERYRYEYLEAHDRLTRAGYLHYEVSNFALPGHRSRHNAVYWSGAPYLGLGNGAHSFLPPVRRWNLREWDAYSARAEVGELALDDEERLTPEAVRMERGWLALRTDAGLPESELDERGRKRVGAWIRAGLAERRPLSSARGPSRPAHRVVLTPLGWLELDRLAVEIEGHLMGVPAPTG
jgi:oxygen-independent coproporphyrinogen-3 oxidase